MISSWLFVATFIPLCQVVVSNPTFSELLARQAPGTPSYNCHDNCGTAITQSRQPSPCTNSAFVQNYNNCLQCAGPDNYNIWRLYGTTLIATGTTCGFKTEPLTGKQPDVGPASASGASNVTSSTYTAVATSSRSVSSLVTSGPSSSASSVTGGTSMTSTASRSPTPTAQTSNPAARFAGSEKLMVAGFAGFWLLAH